MELARELSIRCNARHSHQPLVDDRASEAAKYPEELCQAIVRGLIKQLEYDGAQVRHLLSVHACDEVQMKEPGWAGHLEDDHTHAWDDVTGKTLDPKEVMRARLKELSYIRKKGVWKKITRKEALRRGIKII